MVLALTYTSYRTTYRLWYTGISELLSSSKSKKTEDLADQTTACLDNFPGFLMSLLSRSFQKGTHETWVYQHMATPACLPASRGAYNPQTCLGRWRLDKSRWAMGVPFTVGQSCFAFNVRSNHFIFAKFTLSIWHLVQMMFCLMRCCCFTLCTILSILQR